MQTKPAMNIEHVSGLPNDAIVSVRAIAALTGTGISTVWRYAKFDTTFPKPIKLTARCTRWRIGEVREWMAAKQKG